MVTVWKQLLFLRTLVCRLIVLIHNRRARKGLTVERW